MELGKFIENFSAQFEDFEIVNINKDVNYKVLDTWDSLTTMSIQVMVEDEYGIKLSAQEIKTPNTVEELFILIKSKLNFNE